MKTIFESEKINYVEVSESLIADYLEMVNDIENVDRFIGSHHAPYSEEQEISWVRAKLKEKDPVFSMIEKSTGEFIGNIEIMDPNGFQGELGIAITARKQEQGFGTEAVSAMVRYALGEMGLKRVWLRTKPDNTRAIHVYRKCGFFEFDRRDGRVFMEYRN